jgi:hypothetical protein
MATRRKPAGANRNATGDDSVMNANLPLRRTVTWILVLVLGLLPVLATGMRQWDHGRQVVAGFMSNSSAVLAQWGRPFAGEEASVSTDGSAGVMIRERGLASYAITQAFQDQPGLYQGTVAAAWPARPSWQGSMRLRLVSEPAAPCREIDRTKQVALDDCR